MSVTGLCFGSSALGSMPDTYGYAVTGEQARDTVRAIFASRVNFLDTSRNYGSGRSEARIGGVIRNLGGLPDGMVLSTKLDRDMVTNRLDATRVRASFEQSLAALGIERVSVLHLHDPEYASDLDAVRGRNGAIAELFRLKEEGLADAVGLAMGRLDLMTALLPDWDFDCLITHNRYTLMNRSAQSVIDAAYSRGIAVFNAAPYGGGMLAKGSGGFDRYVYQEATAQVLTQVRAIEDICARHQVPLGAAALQFSLRDPRITSTICGVTRPQRVDETLAWADYPTTAAFWDEMNAITPSMDDPEASRVYKPG